MTVALYGFKARGSPYTVRVLALKLEEEGDQMEVSLLNSSYKLSFSFLEIFENLSRNLTLMLVVWNKFRCRRVAQKIPSLYLIYVSRYTFKC